MQYVVLGGSGMYNVAVANVVPGLRRIHFGWGSVMVGSC
jgi:hypothetical protein